MRCPLASQILEGVEFDVPADPSAMVQVKEQGHQVGRLCYHAKEDLPRWDKVVARYMMLRCAERQVWRRATKHQDGTNQRIHRLAELAGLPGMS